MVAFFTPVEITPAPFTSGYSRKHIFIGSCFAENMGFKMQDLKFTADVNPFGILFNPASAAACINRLVSGKLFTENELFYHEGLWHSFQHHGRFSAPSPLKALSGINERLMFSAEFLRKADFLVLTFGTAWVYELKSSGVTVSNCHKVQASEFRRFRLSVDQVVTTVKDSLEQLWKVNPGIRVIFTVSPVRHLKDGATGNQLSKATLLLAAETLVQSAGHDRSVYFPAYELMMDELRDYRYYAEDMVHPSPVAVDFIREKFTDWFLDKESRETAGKIIPLIQARDHRPLNRDTIEYQNFVQSQMKKIDEITKKHPFLDFSAEIEYFAKEAGPGFPRDGDLENKSNNTDV
jgi:hypothetical protein